MECKKGTRKIGYDLLAEECIECEFVAECKESRIKEREDSEEKILNIKEDTRENFTAADTELCNYRGCLSVTKNVMSVYKESGLRKRKGYKDRNAETKPEIKKISKLTMSDNKLDLLIYCAEYIYFGAK